MEIKIMENITIGDIVNGYENNDEDGGVVGFGGKLNIRPKYQREFVYTGKDENKKFKVIDSILKNRPLNVMYWAKNTDGTYEIIDGQQRTISFCEYFLGAFSVEVEKMPKYFDGLSTAKQAEILKYPLMIYECDGDDDDRLEWFNIINTQGKPLNEQELLNANYTGAWLTSAKKYFSKTKCVAYMHGEPYINGTPINQEYLETVLSWISGGKGNIKQYMADHRKDENADELWNYFRAIIDWIKATFTTYRKVMKGLPWGEHYNAFNKNEYDSAKIEIEISKFMTDPYVKNKAGIYLYMLDGNKRNLQVRLFDDATKITKYEQQKGICPDCLAQGINKVHKINEMDADHITAWSKGGATTVENCTMLCKYHNKLKGNA